MTAFLDPGADRLASGYQINQSLIGLGAGKLVGVGFGQGQQKLGFLPYPYSDFIFATIGEEWGFVGVVFLVVLYSAWLFLALRLARSASDPFLQYLWVKRRWKRLGPSSAKALRSSLNLTVIHRWSRR